MMNDQDRAAIDELFRKMTAVERDGAPRDREAESLIQARLASQPGAAYYMAQTIVVQEQALAAAQQHIESLQRQPEAAAETRSGGGFLSSVWGGQGRREEQPMGAPRRGSVPAFGSRDEPAQAGIAPNALQGRAGGGGGFLAGAAQTAMGVAGGVLLGNAIGGMFGGGGGEAQAATATPASDTTSGNDADTGVQDASDTGDEGGGGFFDSMFGGGEDDGGDFGEA